MTTKFDQHLQDLGLGLGSEVREEWQLGPGTGGRKAGKEKEEGNQNRGLRLTGYQLMVTPPFDYQLTVTPHMMHTTPRFISHTHTLRFDHIMSESSRTATKWTFMYDCSVKRKRSTT